MVDDSLGYFPTVCTYLYIMIFEFSSRISKIYCVLWTASGQSSWLENGDVLCFLWGTNWIYTSICYVEESRPPLWSSGQSSWLQIGDVLCFLRGMNWIYICYVERSRPPLWSSGQSSWLQNGDVLCFLWGMNWINICYVEESWPPLWCSGGTFAYTFRLEVYVRGYFWFTLFLADINTGTWLSRLGESKELGQ
jgi:hypothetical protein